FIMSLVIGGLSVRLVLNNPTLPENTDGHLTPQNLHHVPGHDPRSFPVLVLRNQRRIIDL
ncbi:hypothetical protein ACDY96_13650, partial [Rhizobium mongolense]